MTVLAKLNYLNLLAYKQFLFRFFSDLFDFHVAAVVDFIDGEPHIIELYAVDDNGKKI